MITTTQIRPADIDMASQSNVRKSRAVDPNAPYAHDIKVLSSSTNTDELNRIVEELSKSMVNRLQDVNCISMMPTSVTRLPTGSEKGSCLSVDLGGSTCRVAFVQLYGSESQEKFKVLYKVSHEVDKETKNLDGKSFFNWIALKIRAAIEHAISVGVLERDYDDLVMGLSWSFPFKQVTVERGIIERMGKGYDVSQHIEGWDLKDAFEEAAKDVGIRVKVTAVVNDTLASLIAHAYTSLDTKMSLILGTGLNACAMLPLSKMKDKINGLKFEAGATQCLVNTELSLMGAGIIPETSWDRQIDITNEKPGFQPFEEKVSGRYLGEIARLILSDIISNGEILAGQYPNGWDKPYELLSRTLSEVEGYFYDGKLEKARSALLQANDFGSIEITDIDLSVIIQVFVAVSTRAAALTAAALVAVSQILPSEIVGSTIAYDGSVVENYPKFVNRVQEYLALLGQPRNRALNLEPTGDGSLLGPAIASAMFKQRA